ncbi:uncharacterized protein LOC106641963 [Copidosoma floridanum]|uniref:uncharacterized protein LOC106641963 n=1 Tax=Copidosoma floridanum TaxID=29053 RepID=UPI0006C9E38F|nr:uncharacterized protein LOC106641963 [Copidosoma floridanum]
MLWRLRRYIRRNYKPFPEDDARKHKLNLSLVYALASWNLFGYLVYYLAKESFPKENSAAEYAKFLGVTQANIIKYKDFSKVEEYEVEIAPEDHRILNIFEETYGVAEKE